MWDKIPILMDVLRLNDSLVVSSFTQIGSPRTIITIAVAIGVAAVATLVIWSILLTRKKK